MAYKRDDSLSDLTLRGNDQEKKTFTELIRHYQMAKQDLEDRLTDWDKKDELFRSYIDEDNWPYDSVLFDPRVFTFIFEKTARLFARKPRGRLIPREGGDALGAKINNELLMFQWDENERLDNWPMIAKWAMMDQNARKYGASYALCKWHWERRPKADGKDKKGQQTYKSLPWFDGPNLRPLVNRDCLPNPSYSTIKMWFQHRDYLTLDELQNINDSTRSKPIYKNLDLLRQAIRDDDKGSVADKRESNWASKNKQIKNLTDFLGHDETFKVIEIVTEYRNRRWITFAPKHGVVIRDIDNPYKHGGIPVVMLRYYQVDDDLYGLSEIEPVERLQKAVNALLCQNVDTLNRGLNNILKVRSTGVQMHTLEFGAGKKWIMNDPLTDVVEHQFNPTGIREFTGNYRLLIGSMLEALGETSAAVSTALPGAKEKTATEIRDTAMQRNARDNFNQIFLAEAIKKQMMFWHSMNQQFLFSNPREQQKVIRVVGKDAIRYFEMMGLNKYNIDKEAEEILTNPDLENLNLNPEDLARPLYPVEVGNDTLSKFTLEEGGEVGSLIIEPEDIEGTYDYIPDIESMQLPDSEQLIAAKSQMIEVIQNPAMAQMLAQEGYKVKTKEILEDYFEDLGLKDADKYFEKVQTGGFNAQIGQAGGAIPQAGQAGQGNVPAPRMAGSGQAMAGGQIKPVIPGPGPV